MERQIKAGLARRSKAEWRKAEQARFGGDVSRAARQLKAGKIALGVDVARTTQSRHQKEKTIMENVQQSEKNKKSEAIKAEKVAIPAPRFEVATFTLRGDAPYVSNKFSAEAREMMRAKQAAGSQAKKGAKRDPKDFDKCYRESMHTTSDGQYGVPATCFRQAMVSACRIVGFKMTLAKLALFIVADAEDADDASPLVLFAKGTPKHFEAATRNETGVADIRVRGKWDIGWEIKLRVRYDADMFEEKDVRNLLERVGVQVGIGAGRPDSKTSCGQGWGTFTLV